MKFTEDETCKFMELYNEYECLWNLGTVHYRNRNKRQAAEEEIVERFGKIGFGVSELKQKIKNLRCTYNQECIKILKSKKSGSGSAEVYVPNLKWFPIMDNIVKSAKGNKKTDDSLESVVHNPENIEENEIELIVDDPNSEKQTPQRTREILSGKRSASGKCKEKPSIKKRKIEHLAEAVHDLRRVTESVYGNENNTNEHDAFGNFVAASLKVLPTGTALIAQHEIQGVLMKHRLSIISQEETWTPTSSDTYTVNCSRPTTSPDLVFIEQEDISQEVILEFNQNNSFEDASSIDFNDSGLIKRAMNMNEN